MKSCVFVLIVSLLAALGCDSADPTADAVARANSTNILRIANLYNAYQYRNEMRGPADEGTLKEFVAGLDAETLKRIGLESGQTESVFMSERDSQPFKIRYGVRGNMMGSTDAVVFEATGVNGNREVGFLNMTSREVDAAEYDDLWAGKTAPPAPSR